MDTGLGLLTAAALLLVVPAGSREGLEAFVDGIFIEEMQRSHIPGAAFVLVEGGQIVLSRGFGYADLERGLRVVPDRTLFRVASVSKLVTATAVMQLVEQEELSLHEDVRTYLRLFELRSDFEEPVTVAHLLTHTAGFDDRHIGIAARAEARRIPLGEYLRARLPPVVLPPGETISYSNHGFALAGHLVETVSGVPFARYAQENILRPLDMRRSSFDLPPDLRPDLAVGYVRDNARHRALPLDYSLISPAGSLITTPEDIARFMIAHLNEGRYGNVRILNESTAGQMHRRQFTHHPGLPGFAFGFYEHLRNGRRMLMHDGNWGGFASRLVLIPEHQAGLFVVCNLSQDRLREIVLERVLDRYYPPDEPAAPAEAPRPGGDVARFTGTYRNTRHSRLTFEKFALLHGTKADYRVTEHGGALLVESPREEKEPLRCDPAGRLLFRCADDTGYIAFREGADGAVTHLFLQLPSPAALQRIAWYETAAVHKVLSAFFALVFLATCSRWLRARLMGRLEGGGASGPPPGRLGWNLAVVLSAVNMTFLLGFLLTLARDPTRIFYGVPWEVVLLLALPIVTTPMALILLPLNVMAWKRGYWSLSRRLHHSLVTLAALGFVAFLNYWNLLGFHF